MAHPACRSRAGLCSLAVLVAFVGGCGSGLDSGSTCEDFMNASAEEQQAAIDKIATGQEASDTSTPLGAPEVARLCSQRPTGTLEGAITSAD